MGGGTQCGGAALVRRATTKKSRTRGFFPRFKTQRQFISVAHQNHHHIRISFFFGAAVASMQCSKESVRDCQFAAVAFQFSMDLIERIARIATPPTPAHSVASFVGVGTI